MYLTQVNGIKGASILSAHKPFKLPTGAVIDVMHCILLGVMTNLMNMWFGVGHRSKPYSIRRKVHTTTLKPFLRHPFNLVWYVCVLVCSSSSVVKDYAPLKCLTISVRQLGDWKTSSTGKVIEHNCTCDVIPLTLGTASEYVTVLFATSSPWCSPRAILYSLCSLSCCPAYPVKLINHPVKPQEGWTLLGLLLCKLFCYVWSVIY